MSTQVPPYQEDTTQRLGQAHGGPPGQWSPSPGKRGSKPFFLTSEFLVLVTVVLTLVIAAAVADNFTSPQLWTLVTILGGAYILSRGLSKAGVPKE